MDLLFKRYASPFLLLDSMLQSGGLAEFVTELLRIRSKENDDKTLWEFFLHKIYDKSYAEFIESVQQTTAAASVSREEIEATVKHAFEILNNFEPVDRW